MTTSQHEYKSNNSNCEFLSNQSDGKDNMHINNNFSLVEV